MKKKWNSIMEINSNPNLRQLNEVKLWLIEEKKTSNRGFYCNWKIIEESFNEKQLFFFELEQSTIGFIAWTKFERYVAIDIMER